MRSISAAAALLAFQPLVAQSAPEGRDWPRSSAREQGLNPAPIDNIIRQARAHRFGNVNGLVVVRNGYLVFDERFDRDYSELSRGRSGPLGCGLDACASASAVHQYNYLHPDFHPRWQGRELHTLQSITKSVTATLIGIALQRGEIASVDAPLVTFLAAYDLTGTDRRLADVTLRDVLTMRSGIEWHETDRPLDATNTTVQLERSADWIRFTLAQPMDANPGSKWVYNSGGTQLLAEVIRSATGEHLSGYAERHLFEPLGIVDFHWKRTPSGHPDALGGLYLAPPDLARIGQLYLSGGTWNGRRILPEGWVRVATARHVEHVADDPASPGYGFQWWRYDRRGEEVWASTGFGGQLLLILPAHGIVSVVSSWNVFGDQVERLAPRLIEALLSAAGVPTRPD